MQVIIVGLIFFLVFLSFSRITNCTLSSEITILLVEARWRVWPLSLEERAMRAMVLRVKYFKDKEVIGCQEFNNFRSLLTGQKFKYLALTGFS